MNKRIAAICMITILTIACTFVVLSHTNNNDDSKSIYDTWYATYEESISLDSYEIEMMHHPMDMMVMPLVIDDNISGFLRATWDGKEIRAVVLNNKFSFECIGYGDSSEVYCYIEAKHIEDRILFTVTMYDSGIEKIVRGAHVQYTRQGTVPTNGIDTVDFNNEYIPKYRHVFTEQSIIDKKDIPLPTCPSISLSDKSSNMINVFTLSNGLRMVVVSNGYDMNGCATGFVIGMGNFHGYDNYLLGSTIMSKDRFVMCYHLDLSDTSIYAARLEYKVESKYGEYKEPNIKEGVFQVNVYGILPDGSIKSEELVVTITISSYGVNIFFRDRSGEPMMSFIGTVKGYTVQGIMSTPGGSGYFISEMDEEWISMAGIAYFPDYNAPFHCRIPI